MNREGQLIKYRGQLKYLREKYLKRLDLIERYISRIETETAQQKDALSYEEDKELNKDLVIELERLLFDLGER